MCKSKKEEKIVMKQKKFGVRSKLLVFILPMVALAFIALIQIADNSTRSSLEEKTARLLEAEGKSGINTILAWENENIGILDTAVETMVNLKMTDEELLEYEEFFMGTYEDFPNGIYITYSNGVVVDASGWQPEGDATEGAWYVEGVEHETMMFGEPYLDSFTGTYVVTASRFVNRLNGKGAVVAADVGLDILSEVVGTMEVEGDGDAFIIEANTGVMLAHKDTTLMGAEISALEDSFYSDVYAQIQSGDLTTNSYDSKDGAYMVCIQQIDGTNWYLVTRALEDVIYADVEQVSMLLMGVGVAVLVAITVALIIIISRITKPIEKLTDTIVAVTDGDFTTDVEVVPSCACIVTW